MELTERARGAQHDQGGRRVISVKTVEPLGIQLAGSSGWPLRWLLIDTDADEILMFMDADCIHGCGTLVGEFRRMTLVFDHNGLVRSYFKVFDPDSNTCVGNARCLKMTARRIVEILARSATP